MLACIGKMLQLIIANTDPKLVLGKSKYRLFVLTLHEPIVLGIVTPNGWRSLRVGDTPVSMYEEELGRKWEFTPEQEKWKEDNEERIRQDWERAKTAKNDPKQLQEYLQYLKDLGK